MTERTGPDVGLPWWPADRSEAADRAPLTRARIVETALRLIDRDGLDALSMRRLGDELGAGATSLYWHVPNKDVLLDLVLDEILGEAADRFVSSDDWRTELRDAANTLRRVLVRHGHAAILCAERQAIGPKALAGLDRWLGDLIRAGFEPRLAMMTVNTIVNFASGWAVFECRTPAGPIGEGRTPAEIDALVLEGMRALPADRYPALVGVVTSMEPVSSDEQFAFTLDSIIEGVAARLATQIGPPGLAALEAPTAAPGAPSEPAAPHSPGVPEPPAAPAGPAVPEPPRRRPASGWSVVPE